MATRWNTHIGHGSRPRKCSRYSTNAMPPTQAIRPRANHWRKESEVMARRILQSVMPHAIRIDRHGGPEVMQWVEHAPGEPGPGEVRLRHTAVGLNYIDTYHRSGLYPLKLPSGLGSEAAGVVEARGSGVTDFAVGDRVAYAGGAPGSYAQARVMPAARLVRLPAGVDDRVAAAVLLKGMTAQYLLRRTFPLKRG